MGAFKLGIVCGWGDGRIGRVRGRVGGKVRVRVRRKTSETHQFLMVVAAGVEEGEVSEGMDE